MKKLALLFSLFVSSTAFAGIEECSDVYVDMFAVKDHGQMYVTFKNKQGQTSRELFFTNWNEEGKKSAISLLITAKMAKTPVTVRSDRADECSIFKMDGVLKALYVK